jgi:CCR4-NOT transcription complex subunit 1
LAVYSSSRYPSTLPESLRLRPGGLTAPQFRLYEDFTRLRGLFGENAAPQNGVAPQQHREGPEEPYQTPQAVEVFTVCVLFLL